MDVKTTGRRFAAAAGLVVSLLLAASGAHAQAAYRIHVDGLACPFCAYGIEKKLGAVDGVARVETDIATGTVLVTMAGEATLEEAAARRAVKEAGFSLRRFEPVAPAAADGAAK